MLRVRTLGLALVAVFAFSAVAVSSASAIEWQLGKAKIEKAKASTAETVEELTLRDVKEKSAIKCKGSSTGKVGPGVADTIETAKATGCTVIEGPCEAGTATAVAVNLPWTTTYVLNGTEKRDNITTTGSNPGYKVECRVFGIFKVQDECTGNTSVKLTNQLTGVLGTFEKTPKGTCTRGGAGQGEVIGTVINKVAGGVLEAN